LIDHPDGLSIEVLAGKCNIAPWKLASVLRLLAAEHCFREVAPGVFANNRLSLSLAKTNDVSYAIRLLTSQYHINGMANFYDALIDPVYGPASDPGKSSLAYGLVKSGFHGTFYDYIKNDRTRSEYFSRSIQGYDIAIGHMCVIEEFPWGELPSGTTICDVGGGIGNMSIALLKRYSHVKVVLQDLPSVISNSIKVWNNEYPSVVAGNRITFTPFDFFKEEPVHGLDIYYLSHVIHNWFDEDSIRILRSIRNAMDKNSRLLIHEIILPAFHNGREGHVRKAPEPLLASFGGGALRANLSDINMLNLCNARERQLDEFIYLGKEAGLEFTRIWDFIENGIIEFRKVA